MKLKGKIGWVTGAGSGIGEAAALALAAEGAAVILTGRTESKLSRVAAAIKAQYGAAHVLPADVSNADQVEAVAAFIRACE